MKKYSAMKRYRIIAYIRQPIEIDEEWTFDTKEEAITELEQLKLMQPENIYKLEKFEIEVVDVKTFPSEEQIEQDINYREKD